MLHVHSSGCSDISDFNEVNMNDLSHKLACCSMLPCALGGHGSILLSLRRLGSASSQLISSHEWWWVFVLCGFLQCVEVNMTKVAIKILQDSVDIHKPW